MTGSPVGIIVNPAAGKDVRRLVAHAATVSDAAKVGIVRRAVLGAAEGGAARVLIVPDTKRLAERAVDGLDGDVPVAVVPLAVTGRAADTVGAARALQAAGCGAVVVLGGDGTNRNVAQGWPDAPVVAVSTGTNNVFPRFVDGTVAGMAAGLVASGRVALSRVSSAAKVVHVELPGRVRDVALVDAVLVAGSFTGSRAVWDAEALLAAVLSCAEPDAVGLSAIGGLLQPCGRDEAGGLNVVFGEGGQVVRAPIAPGLHRDVAVATVDSVAEGDVVEWRGPGVVALDGEREHVLGSGEVARLVVRRDGPLVIDATAALRTAAEAGVFVRLGEPSERRQTRAG